MKSAASVLLAATLAFALAADAWAGGRGRSGGSRSHSGVHHGGVRPGFVHHPHFARGAVIIGAPLFFYPGPYYYSPPPPPYYYAPAPVYVEPYNGTSAPQTQDWFYCPNLGAYYPYVKQCPGGWQRVLLQQPSEPPPVG